MHIPSPSDLGLPEKFDRWRPKQVEALRWLLSSQRRVKTLCMPTGGGKSAVYVGYALITKQPTCVVTESRALQVQLMKDFEPCGMVNLWGRKNYDCQMRSDWTCEDGYAARCPHKGSVQCPSSQAEMRAAASMLVVTNYDKWTSSKKYGQGMDHFTQVVFDEGHLGPDKLASAMQVTLHSREIEETLGIPFPRGPLEFVNWKPWATECRAEAESIMLTTKEALKGNPQPALIKHYLHMRNLTKRLATLSTANPANWVVDEVKTGYQFDPVRAAQYAESTLLVRVPSILFVSATIRPKTMYLCGVGKDHFDFKEFDSDFDPKRCPIYYIPTMRVDSRAKDFSMLWVLLNQIAAKRNDRKGIVHTISYARRDEIVRVSRFVNRMLINPRGEASTGTVQEFKEAGPGTILVSPSVGAGFDFPGRECEWQFVCKIPFPDGRSKIQQARQENDKEYGPFQATTKLEQIFGRGMRDLTDSCEGFIGDEHLDWFLPRYGHFLSKFFHKRFKRVTVLPQPPPKL